MIALSTLFGLPAHPLLVHVPVVLVPFALVTALFSIWGKHRTPFAIATAVMAVAGGFGALLAADAGEALDESINKKSDVLRDHVQMGDTAKIASVLFAFFAVILLVVVLLRVWQHPRVRKLADRLTLPTWVAPLALVATIASGAYATYTIINAGHSGAKSVWQDKVAALKAHSGEGDD